jgi:hypothetical protein
MSVALIFMLIGIGLTAGVASGLFGIGGGVLIVPALIYFAKFNQHAAIGTSLAIMLPPVGLAAVMEYYRNGNVDFKAAFIVATALLIGGWIGANFANQINGYVLKMFFGLFVLGVGGYLVFDAVKALTKMS